MNKLSLLLSCLLSTPLLPLVADDFSAQSPDLAPRKAEEGIQFRFQAPGAEHVYLAGSFNNWADNDEGRITNQAFAMLREKNPDLVSRYVALEKGVYFLKFAVDTGTGKVTWVVPDYWASRDHSDNAKLWITEEGNPYFQLREAANFPTKQADGEVKFSLLAPQVKSVHLAGSFNNWADNQDGKVNSTSHALHGPDENGVWTLSIPLAPGEHAYQFVLDESTWVQDSNQQAEDAENHSLITVK